jgi:hypothetical protein
MARNSRLLSLIPAVVLVAGIAAFAATRLGGTSPAPAAARAAPVDPAAVQVAHVFLSTAVARKNLDAAYEIVAPDLKEGMTPKEWETGTIPVVPYPVAEAKTQLKPLASFTDSALFQVTFTPLPASTAKPGAFVLSERKVGGQWLVDSWTAKSSIGAPSSK